MKFIFNNMLWILTALLVASSIVFAASLCSIPGKPKVTVDVNGMMPEDVFACIYFYKADLNPQEAYKFANKVMEVRKRK